MPNVKVKTIHISQDAYGEYCHKDVEALVVSEVFATYESFFESQRFVTLCSGDDGWWKDIMTVDQHWLPGIVEAISKQIKGVTK